MRTSQFKLFSSYIYQDEFEIVYEHDLSYFLHDLLKFGNIVVLLESPDSGKLTIGLGIPFGFVEFMDNSGNPPYLIATDNYTNKGKDFFVEFDSGGTLTPIPADKCLPYDTVIEIAKYFITNKKLPNSVNWIQV
jgi:hypothetical protein